MFECLIKERHAAIDQKAKADRVVVNYIATIAENHLATITAFCDLPNDTPASQLEESVFTEAERLLETLSDQTYPVGLKHSKPQDHLCILKWTEPHHGNALVKTTPEGKTILEGYLQAKGSSLEKRDRLARGRIETAARALIGY